MNITRAKLVQQRFATEVARRRSPHKTQTFMSEDNKASLSASSQTCKLGWHSRSRSTLTTPMWPLLTPMCSGVWRRLFLALRSPPPRCSSSMTAGSSPKAAWCTARSPSLSCGSSFHSIIMTSTNTQTWSVFTSTFIWLSES